MNIRLEQSEDYRGWGHNVTWLRWCVAQPHFILLRKSAALPLSSFQSR